MICSCKRYGQGRLRLRSLIRVCILTTTTQDNDKNKCSCRRLKRNANTAAADQPGPRKMGRLTEHTNVDIRLTLKTDSIHLLYSPLQMV